MSRARGYNKQSKRLLALLLLLVLAGAAAVLLWLRPWQGGGDQPAAPEQQAEPAPEEEKQEPVVAHLVVGGDVMSHMPQTNDAYTGSDYDYYPMLRALQPLLADADYAVANLETTFSGGPDYSGYPTFNTPDQLARDLKKVGFDLVSTANNHCMDGRYEGLERTLDVLDQNGLAHVGTYRDEGERAENRGVYVADVGGISVAFLSYTYGTNGIPVSDEHPGTVNLFNVDYMTDLADIDEELIQADMAYARSLETDLIAVMVHWGTEYQTEQNSRQEELAQLLMEEGADLILGGHPHVLQPAEFRTVTLEDGSEHTAFVCFSLGNLISAQNDEYTDTTALLDLELTLDPETGACAVSRAAYLPLYMLDQEEEVNGERFVLLDAYAALAEYRSGQSTLVNDAVAARLEKAIADCQSILAPLEDVTQAAWAQGMLWHDEAAA